MLTFLLGACTDESGETSSTCAEPTHTNTTVEWNLPPMGGDKWFDDVPWPHEVGESWREVDGDHALYLWDTLDLTGDGRKDLVVTRDGADGQIGRRHWDVYVGEEAGFSDTALVWEVPTIDGDTWRRGVPWPSTTGVAERSTETGLARYQWTVLDLTGDGLLDLVLTEDQAGSTIGTTVWSVYPGNGTRFARHPTEWALPTIDGSGWMDDSPWPTTAGAGTRDADGDDYVVYYWTVHDLTGDARPDLALTIDASDKSIGRDAWSVFASDGTGFATTPAAWALPPLDGHDWTYSGPWPATGGEASRTFDDSEAIYDWALVELTGDGLDDLLLTRDELDPTIGDAWWNVYPSDGGGFATEPTEWTLPTLEGEAWDEGVPWPKMSDNRSRMTDSGEASYSWGVMELTGDRAADLVLTKDGTGATVGTDAWTVYPARDDGFDATVELWALPALDGESYDNGVPWPTLNGWNGHVMDGARAQYFWDTVDLSGDGLPELVLTSDEADLDVGTTHWVVTYTVCTD